MKLLWFRFLFIEAKMIPSFDIRTEPPFLVRMFPQGFLGWHSFYLFSEDLKFHWCVSWSECFLKASCVGTVFICSRKISNAIDGCLTPNLLQEICGSLNLSSKLFYFCQLSGQKLWRMSPAIGLFEKCRSLLARFLYISSQKYHTTAIIPELLMKIVTHARVQRFILPCQVQFQSPSARHSCQAVFTGVISSTRIIHAFTFSANSVPTAFPYE